MEKKERMKELRKEIKWLAQGRKDLLMQQRRCRVELDKLKEEK